jgi:hypothetical protein
MRKALKRLRKKSKSGTSISKFTPRDLNGLRKEGEYWENIPKNNPSGAKSLNFSATYGTTKVVP